MQPFYILLQTEEAISDMIVMTFIIVAVLLVGYLMMSTEQVNHINRAAVAMFCGVIVWILYMIHGGDYLRLMHPEEYDAFLGGRLSTPETVKEFVANNIIVKYISEACSVILFLIATNTIVEVMNNNGVFDSLVRWLRMRSSKRFLWVISILTFFISANVDNLTTVVLMISIMGQVVRSHYQRVIYACAIMIAANLGGSFTVIGDMTSLMLWVRGVITPSVFAAGLFLPAFSTLCIFNLLVSSMLVGKVEVSSILSRYDGDDSYLSVWQKILILVIGLAGLWSIPTLHLVTKLPPFLGALCVLALIWVVEGICNLERNGNILFVQRHYLRNTEFIGMRIILYFIGISLGVGVLKECGFLDFIANWLENNVDNVYIYGVLTGLISSVVDNVPFVMIGMNLFPFDMQGGAASEFVLNGAYWQLLSFCCAIGGSLLFVGSLAGQSVLQLERIRIIWYVRHIMWRVFVAWAGGMLVFWLTH